MTRLTVVSLFSGGGALDLGFEASGANIVFAAEIMPEACQTLRLNFPNTFVFGYPYYTGDVADLNLQMIKQLAGVDRTDTDILTAGPPCQTFSVAAAQRFLKGDIKFKRSGFQDRKRGQLIFEALRIILDLRPKSFIIENVPGIVSIDGGRTIKTVCKTFSEAGYSVTGPFILNSMQYGVPQERHRAFLVGFLGRKTFVVPEPNKYNMNNGLHHFRTVAEALIDFNYSLENSTIRNHKSISVARYRLLKYGQRDHLGRVDRLNPLAPSKTVIAGGSNGGGRSHLHPFIARTLSVRESARLQTFPDNFIFLGKIGRQFTQVGNAVPPLLAEIIAREMMQQFFECPAPNDLRFEVKPNDPIKAALALREWSIREHPDTLYEDISIDEGSLKLLPFL